MYSQVLVALEFSPAAVEMIRCLPGLRELGAEKLTLIHVAEVGYPVFGAVAHIDEHRKRLEGMVPAIAAAGFQVEVVASAGQPAGEILKAAEERRASLILIGSRSHSRLREAFIGSVASKVIRRSRLPVLLQRIEPVGDEAGEGVVGSCCNRDSEVIVPTDFSDGAEHAFSFAEGLAHGGARSFCIVHVQQDGRGGRQDTTGKDRARLEALAKRLRDAGAGSVSVEVRAGDPAREILEVARRSADSLIVIAVHGRHLLTEAVLGSVSKQVVRQASGSVLIVPASWNQLERKVTAVGRRSAD
jgi:nucleotide-binding universal stress UspA family protein